MEFLRHLLVALAIFAVGFGLAATADRTSTLSHVYFFIGALGAQIWLFVAAIRLRAQHLPRFDMIVASELIIALGILALICGIFISVVFALQHTEQL
jgi:hypothetical protein